MSNNEADSELKGIWKDLLVKFPEGTNDYLCPKGSVVHLKPWAYDFRQFKVWAIGQGYEEGSKLSRTKGGSGRGGDYLNYLRFSDSKVTGDKSSRKNPRSLLKVTLGGKLLHQEAISNKILRDTIKSKKGKFKAFSNEATVKGLSKLKGLRYEVLDISEVGCEEDWLRESWDNFHSKLDYKRRGRTLIGLDCSGFKMKCDTCGYVRTHMIIGVPYLWHTQYENLRGCYRCSQKKSKMSNCYMFSNSIKKINKMSVGQLEGLGSKLEFGG